MRFNANQQNYARIPEGQARRIGKIDSARNELSEELGRDPTHEEIAELLNSRLVGKEKALSGKQVAKIQASRINDVVLSSLEQDPSPNAINRDREIISLLRPTLKPDEQVVFDHLYGINGRPLISSTNELARTLGKQPSQISRLRSSILKRVQNA
jgi:DNA-directed RNA polymerase specialized sigma subunit